MKKVTLSAIVLFCGLACLHGQTTQKPKWVLLSQHDLEGQDPDVKKATFENGQTYQLVSQKPKYLCTVSINQNADGLRLSVLSTPRKKIVIERNFIDLGWMKRMPSTPRENLKYDPNGKLVRDENPRKSGFENKCGDFLESLPQAIRDEVFFALK